MRLVLPLICASLCWGQAALVDPGAGKGTKAEKDSARLAVWKRPTTKVKDKTEPDAKQIDLLRESRIKHPGAGYDELKSKKKVAFAPTRYSPTASTSSTVIVFPSQAIANAVMKEIAVTPSVEGGSGPVWVWFDPYSDVNEIGMNCEPDAGRCAIAHWWSLDSPDVAWLQAYVAESWPEIEFLAAMPEDWEQSDIL